MGLGSVRAEQLDRRAAVTETVPGSVIIKSVVDVVTATGTRAPITIIVTSTAAPIIVPAPAPISSDGPKASGALGGSSKVVIFSDNVTDNHS